MTRQTKTPAADRSRKPGQGSKWIRPERRLAIYARDNFSCVYCGASLESGASLTLDHVRPSSRGGSNDSANLVCACGHCNSARGNKPVARFCRDEGLDSLAVARRIRNAARRTVDVTAAKATIAARKAA